MATSNKMNLALVIGISSLKIDFAFKVINEEYFKSHNVNMNSIIFITYQLQFLMKCFHLQLNL